MQSHIITNCIWLFCGSTSDMQHSAMFSRRWLCRLFVMPRLHYGNATLAGFPEYQYRQTNLPVPEKSAPTRHTSFAKASLATIQTACRLAVLIFRCLEPRTLSSRRYTSRRRHQPPALALVIIGFGGGFRPGLEGTTPSFAPAP